MVGMEFFDRELRLATQDFEPAVLQKALAKYAKDSVAELIATGQASPRFNRFVNGRAGLSEEQVQLPGPIIYQFALWGAVIAFALEELRARSPVKSGRFRDSFIVLANQKLVTDYEAIGPEEEVIITNFQPYIRKIEASATGKKSRFQVFDPTKRALAREFGNEGPRNSAAAFRFETQWLNVGSGVYEGMPYILKGSKDRRKDRQSGMPITYPSIIINQV